MSAPEGYVDWMESRRQRAGRSDVCYMCAILWANVPILDGTTTSPACETAKIGVNLLFIYFGEKYAAFKNYPKISWIIMLFWVQNG